MIPFRISIIGFECFGLFRISSFGIRIFIRERPFGGVYPFDSLRAGSDKGRAQDRLGAKNFVKVVLLNILSAFAEDHGY